MQYILGTNNIDSLRSMKCHNDMFEAAAHYLTISGHFRPPSVFTMAVKKNPTKTNYSSIPCGWIRSISIPPTATALHEIRGLYGTWSASHSTTSRFHSVLMVCSRYILTSQLHSHSTLAFSLPTTVFPSRISREERLLQFPSQISMEERL